MSYDRRHWLQQGMKAAGALALGPALAGCETMNPLPSFSSVPPRQAGRARVLVVGGGWGGATAARYLKLFSEGQLDVVLVEPNAQFVSCPLSNLVVGGHRTLAQISTPYDALSRRHGVHVVRDMVASIDAAKKTAVLASGPVIGWDKLVVAPGIDFQWDAVAGLREAQQSGRILQAWKAGPETAALRRQLEAMPDGGVYAITIPMAPYRCPPGPYERVCQVASYLKAAKPRSKILVLDANPDITSKAGLFRKAWNESYAGMIEYRPNHNATAVDAARNVVKFEVQEEVRADVLNVLPPMRAGALALQAGLTGTGRWATVNYQTFESSVVRDVFVLGDAVLAAPAMPKSGHMANSHAKVAAAAIVAQLNGWAPNPAPMLTNTCYSFVDAKKVVHVASVHEYVAAEKTFKTVAGSGGLSSEANEREGDYAWNWARTIWADMLT